MHHAVKAVTLRNEYLYCIKQNNIIPLAVWSRGMILVLGTRGPVFESRHGPIFLCYFPFFMPVISVHICQIA